MVDAAAWTLGQFAEVVDAIAHLGARFPIVEFDWWVVVPVLCLLVLDRVRSPHRAVPSRRGRAALLVTYLTMWATPLLIWRMFVIPLNLGSLDGFARCSERNSGTATVVVPEAVSARRALGDWQRGRLGDVPVIVFEGRWSGRYREATEVIRARSPSTVVHGETSAAGRSSAVGGVAARYSQGPVDADVSTSGDLRVLDSSCR